MCVCEKQCVSAYICVDTDAGRRCSSFSMSPEHLPVHSSRHCGSINNSWLLQQKEASELDSLGFSRLQLRPQPSDACRFTAKRNISILSLIQDEPCCKACACCVVDSLNVVSRKCYTCWWCGHSAIGYTVSGSFLLSDWYVICSGFSKLAFPLLWAYSHVLFGILLFVFRVALQHLPRDYTDEKYPLGLLI